MKNKWHLFASVFQLLIGLAAIAAFIMLAVSGEVVARWIITLILAVAFAVMGAVGIIDSIKGS